MKLDIGSNANGGNMKLDIIVSDANGGNMKLDIIGQMQWWEYESEILLAQMPMVEI
jgi:hypothetical protein